MVKWKLSISILMLDVLHVKISNYYVCKNKYTFMFLFSYLHLHSYACITLLLPLLLITIAAIYGGGPFNRRLVPSAALCHRLPSRIPLQQSAVCRLFRMLCRRAISALKPGPYLFGTGLAPVGPVAEGRGDGGYRAIRR